MAQSLKSKFQVCWNDASDPAKGFQYIYLDTGGLIIISVLNA